MRTTGVSATCSLDQQAPLAERQLARRDAVHLEQVEDVVDTSARSRLKELEARPPLFVEGAHLAVQDSAAGHRLGQSGGHLGEARRVVVAAPAPQPRLRISRLGNDPVAVEL